MSWEVWAFLPNGDKQPGWSLVARELDQDEAEWMVGVLVHPARAMERTKA